MTRSESVSHSVVSNLFATSQTVACQAPLSMGFHRREYRSGLPCPPPGDLPNPWIDPRSLALQADSLPSEPPGKPFAFCETFHLWRVGFQLWHANSELQHVISSFLTRCGPRVPCIGSLSLWTTRKVPLIIHSRDRLNGYKIKFWRISTFRKIKWTYFPLFLPLNPGPIKHKTLKGREKKSRDFGTLRMA